MLNHNLEKLTLNHANVYHNIKFKTLKDKPNKMLNTKKS